MISVSFQRPMKIELRHVMSTPVLVLAVATTLAAAY
jgi:hypothetical protein